jgi:hypothetical protein
MPLWPTEGGASVRFPTLGKIFFYCVNTRDGYVHKEWRVPSAMERHILAGLSKRLAGDEQLLRVAGDFDFGIRRFESSRHSQ